MGIDFVTLCLMRRTNKLTLDEFGKRLAELLENPDAIENVAIDVEHLVLNQNDDERSCGSISCLWKKKKSNG